MWQGVASESFGGCLFYANCAINIKAEKHWGDSLCTCQIFIHIENEIYNKEVTSLTNVKLQYSGSGYQKDDGMDEGEEVRSSMVHTCFIT